MNIKKIIGLFLIGFIAISLLYNNMYTVGMVSGQYVYNFPSVVAESPRQGEKLLLKKDGTFQSDSWGVGTYRINGAHLELFNNGIQIRSMPIYRPFYWGKLRLSVVPDLEYGFQKSN
jgi:hypothetical protein